MKILSSLQRRKKSEKSGFLIGNSAMLGRKIPTNATGNRHESAPDPLLSLFINCTPFPDSKGIQQDECFRDDASDTADVKRYAALWLELCLCMEVPFFSELHRKKYEDYDVKMNFRQVNDKMRFYSLHFMVFFPLF